MGKFEVYVGMPKLILRAIVALGIVLCTSCSSGQKNPAEGTPRGTPSAASRDGAKVVKDLPIAAYSIGKEEAYDLDLARVAVINECLTKKGTDFRLPQPPGPEDGNSRRYGVVDQGIAEEYGYHDPLDDSAAAQSTPTPNATQKKLLLGSSGSNDGCVAMANTALGSGKPPAKGIEAARTIDVTSFKSSQTSPDVRKAFSEWSACMSRKGYEYTSPLASAGGKWFATPTATESEKRVARADVSCKNKVDLVERWHRAESNIQQRMIERHAKDLKDLTTFQDGLVKRARNLLKKV